MADPEGPVAKEAESQSSGDSSQAMERPSTGVAEHRSDQALGAADFGAVGEALNGALTWILLAASVLDDEAPKMAERRDGGALKCRHAADGEALRRWKPSQRG